MKWVLEQNLFWLSFLWNHFSFFFLSIKLFHLILRIFYCIFMLIYRLHSYIPFVFFLTPIFFLILPTTPFLLFLFHLTRQKFGSQRQKFGQSLFVLLAHVLGQHIWAVDICWPPQTQHHCLLDMNELLLKLKTMKLEQSHGAEQMHIT